MNDPDRMAASPEATNYEHPTRPGERKSVPGEGVADAGLQRASSTRRGKKAPLMAPGAKHADTTYSRSTAEDTQRGVTGEGGALNTDAGPDSPPPLESQEAMPASVAPQGTRPIGSMQTSNQSSPGIPRKRGSELCVADVMSQTLEVCNPDTELDYVAKMMADRDCGAIPVVEDTDSMKPVGIVTDRDIIVRVVARGESPFDRHARDCMSTNLLCVHPEDKLHEAVQELEHRQLRRALVIDEGGHLCGILATADIARCAPDQESAELIRDVSEPTPQGGMYH